MDIKEILRLDAIYEELSNKAMQGEKVQCPHCGEPLYYIAPDKTTTEDPEVGVFCKNKDFARYMTVEIVDIPKD